MKSIILAAGYATRLYPITENFPKPLLKVGENSILDRLISDLDSIPDITEHIIISNHKFIDHFNEWKKNHVTRKAITVLDDGSTENENRLGAVKDIAFALEQCSIRDEIIVLAGDNILDFSLKEFVNYYHEKKSACIMRHLEENVEKLRKTGVATIDENEKVILMQEKPAKPESKWAVPPFYIYGNDDIPYIINAVKENKCGVDAPGDFIAWFANQRPVHAWEMSGSRFDIGDLKSLEEARKRF